MSSWTPPDPRLDPPLVRREEADDVLDGTIDDVIKYLLALKLMGFHSVEYDSGEDYWAHFVKFTRDITDVEEEAMRQAKEDAVNTKALKEAKAAIEKEKRDESEYKRLKAKFEGEE